MSEAEKSQGAEALPPTTTQPLQVSSNPANLFLRVNVLLEPKGGNKAQLDNLPFEATVRLEHDRLTIQRNLKSEGEPDFWSYNFFKFESVDIQEAQAVIKFGGGTISLGFRVELPSRKTDTERFAHLIFTLLPDHVFGEGRHLVDESRYPPGMNPQGTL